MVTLKEAKNYLRVDHSEDDKLIQDLLLTAKKLCMDVGRMDEEQFAENEDTVYFSRWGIFTKIAQILTIMP